MADKTVSLPSGRRVKVRKRVAQVRPAANATPTPVMPQRPVIPPPEQKVVVEPAKPDEVVRQELADILKCGHEGNALMREISEKLDRGDLDITLEVTSRDEDDNIKSVRIRG